jgi:hypothetical protein
MKCRDYVKLEDGTNWPHPVAVGEMESLLRYGTEPLTRADRMRIASVMSAYAQLAMRPDFRAKPPMIRRAVATCLAVTNQLKGNEE